jgi:Flp pilus assembly protein TadB
VQAAEQLKRRRVQFILAAAVMMMVLGGVAVAWWRSEQLQAERSQQERNNDAATALLDQCEAGLRAGDASKGAFAHDAITAPRRDGSWFGGYDSVSRTIS